MCASCVLWSGSLTEHLPFSNSQDDPEKPDNLLVLVQHVGTVREIVYESKRFKMTCTHTIVPGMIVEAVQMRKVDHISPEAPNQAKRAIAQFLNDYSYGKNGPLKLHFVEEVNERGVAQGHPAIRDLTGANAVVKARRASVASALSGGLIKDKKAQEAFEISMSANTARKYSVTGTHVGGPAAKAPAPSGRRGSVTAADMMPPGAGPPGGRAPTGRRGSVVSAGPMPVMAPPGRRGSVSGSSNDGQRGGRRASVSLGGEEDAGVIKYLVVDTATVRAAPSSSSPKIGEHKKGTVIDVIQESIDDRGLQVLLTHTPPEGATKGGWIKLVTSKGKQLLERIGSAEDLGVPQQSSRGGRRGSVSSATGSVDASRGGRRGSITSVGSGPGGRRGSIGSASGMGGRRGSVTSEGSGGYDGGQVLTSETAFEVTYELKGKRTKLEMIIEPNKIVFNNLKTKQVHQVLPYSKLRTNNYARVVHGGVVIGLPGGKDMFLSTDAQDATEISELVYRGKEHSDYKIDKAERRAAARKQKEEQEQKQRQEDDDSASSRSGADSEDDQDEAVPFDASPTTFRTAFMKFKPGDIVDVESEDGWEYGATILGPAKGGDDDEMQIRFADGVVDDWPIADFRRAKVRAFRLSLSLSALFCGDVRV